MDAVEHESAANGAVPNRAVAIQSVRADLNRLRGQLFELVEAVGLPTRQEEAFKRLIRRTTYDSQANLEATLRGAREEVI